MNLSRISRSATIVTPICPQVKKKKRNSWVVDASLMMCLGRRYFMSISVKRNTLTKTNYAKPEHSFVVAFVKSLKRINLLLQILTENQHNRTNNKTNLTNFTDTKRYQLRFKIFFVM